VFNLKKGSFEKFALDIARKGYLKYSSRFAWGASPRPR